MISYEFEGIKEFEAAIRRNPEVIRRRSREFITQGLALYRMSIWRNPWRIGMQLGGAPVATGNLRDTHRSEISDFEGVIRPDAHYAPYVILGTYKMQSRDYLKHAKESQEPQVKQLEEKLLQEIVTDLSK
jgi:hypothetical protein